MIKTNRILFLLPSTETGSRGSVPGPKQRVLTNYFALQNPQQSSLSSAATTVNNNNTNNINNAVSELVLPPPAPLPSLPTPPSSIYQAATQQNSSSSTIPFIEPAKLPAVGSSSSLMPPPATLPSSKNTSGKSAKSARVETPKELTKEMSNLNNSVLEDKVRAIYLSNYFHRKLIFFLFFFFFPTTAS
jgi:hypothetical protein